VFFLSHDTYDTKFGPINSFSIEIKHAMNLKGDFHTRTISVARELAAAKIH